MAPKRKPVSQLKKSATYYRNNEASARRKNYTNSKRNKRPENVKYRVEHNAERRRRGIYGKGGRDVSKTTDGRFVLEDPSTNRARNRAKLRIKNG